MIRVAVLYGNKQDGKFDHAYYADHHMTMLAEKLRPMGLVKCEIDRGISGALPGSPPPYVCIGYMVFHSIEDYQKAWAAHGAQIIADAPAYTDIEPTVQISEIVT